MAGTQEMEPASSGSWNSSCSDVLEQTRPILTHAGPNPATERRRTITGAYCPSILLHPLTELINGISSTGRCPPRACPKYKAHNNAAPSRRANLQKSEPSIFQIHRNGCRGATSTVAPQHTSLLPPLLQAAQGQEPSRESPHHRSIALVILF